jgi:hypothetical protein
MKTFKNKALTLINLMCILYGLQSTGSRYWKGLIWLNNDSMDGICKSQKEVVSKIEVHLHLSYAPKPSISEIVKRLKGRIIKYC